MTQQRRFTKEFEEEAVRLVRTSGRSQREIAEDLGIGLSTLVRWIGRSRDRLLDEPGRPGQEDVAAELKRLRRENEILRQERDILKRATVGSTGQRNMIDFMMFREDPRWREPVDLAYRRSRKESFGSDGRTASRSVTSGGLLASMRARSLVCCKPKVALRRRCGNDRPVL
jgi:transposase